MAVLCLMYHHTPNDQASSLWDVPLKKFTREVDLLVDAGVSFIDFSQVRDPKCLSSGIHVALTFDDGHISNMAAFDYLASRSIRPAAFIVKQWADELREFMSAKEIDEYSSICDFGSHGLSHRNMNQLTGSELSIELSSSKAYLEDIIGSAVDIMALPGGHGDKTVLDEAEKAGYSIVANSIPNINLRKTLSVNRVCITNEHAEEKPSKYATANLTYWRLKRLQRATSSLSIAILGSKSHVKVSKLVKSLSKQE